MKGRPNFSHPTYRTLAEVEKTVFLCELVLFSAAICQKPQPLELLFFIPSWNSTRKLLPDVGENINRVFAF